VEARKLATGDEAKEIKKEIEALPTATMAACRSTLS